MTYLYRTVNVFHVRRDPMKKSLELAEGARKPTRFVSSQDFAKFLGPAILAIFVMAGIPARADTCSNLKSTFSLPHLTITSSETIPAGRFKTSTSMDACP